MKFFSIIFYSTFTILLLGVLGLFLAPLLPIDNNIQIKIVESGSMEPAIPTGSLVVVTPTNSYEENDVITFTSSATKIPTTHRVVGIEETAGALWFTTKGDANEEADTNAVPQSAVIGKVSFSVPYAGFVLDFSRQPIGFMLLIVLPALLIILGEANKIWSEVRKIRNDKTTPKPVALVPTKKQTVIQKSIRMMDIDAPVQPQLHTKTPRAALSAAPKKPQLIDQWTTSIAAMLIVVFFASSGLMGSTVSFANDQEVSTQNLLHASLLDFSVSADSTSFNFLGTELIEGNELLTNTITPENGSINATYEVSVEKIEGNIAFCDAIEVDSRAPAAHDGSLLSLFATDITFPALWELLISLSPTANSYGSGATCVLDIIYTAWQEGGIMGEGYTDTERTQLTFTYTSPNTIQAFKAAPASPLAPQELNAPQEEAAASAAAERIIPDETDPVVETEPPEDSEERPVEEEVPLLEILTDLVETVFEEEIIPIVPDAPTLEIPSFPTTETTEEISEPAPPTSSSLEQ